MTHPNLPRHPRLHGVIAAVALASLLGLSSTLASAQPPEIPPGLLTPENLDSAIDQSGRAAKRKVRKVNKAAIRSRSARIEPLAMDGDTLLLDLFDDATAVAQMDRRRDKPNGTHVWVGHITGVPGSKVVLAERDGVMSGTVRWGGRLYEISPTGAGLHSIEEIDESLLPGHTQPLPAPQQNPSFNEEGTSSSQQSLVSPSASGDATTIDLMVVYTEASRARYNPSDGGADGIETRIEVAVADANQAHINSQINIQYNLVHMSLIDYDESSGSMSKSLQEITGQSDGKADQVHAWRDQHGADLVSLVTEDGGCGIGYLMQNVNSGFAAYGFSVVNSGCLSSQTLAHEMGHNQGAEHDRDNASFEPAYPYSYGHRVSGLWRTIMSYSSGCSGCPRIDHFSNPNVVVNAEPTGVDHNSNPANSADNARTLNNSAAVVAAFRNGGSTPPPPPTAPSSLVASVVSDSQISLSWRDNADNETASEIQRAVNGGGWSAHDTLGANVTKLQRQWPVGRHDLQLPGARDQRRGQFRLVQQR